jgi:hypothetical protein
MIPGLSLSSRVKIPPDVLFRHLQDELVVLALKRGVYFGLDPIGARIWDLLGEERSLQDVLTNLVEEYEVEAAQGAEDVLGLVAELQAQGLLEIAD